MLRWTPVETLDTARSTESSTTGARGRPGWDVTAMVGLRSAETPRPDDACSRLYALKGPGQRIFTKC
ncbi:hypothetical protein GCM10022199_15770 [Marihabitans asiaticum]